MFSVEAMNSTQNLIATLNHGDGTRRRQAALQLGAVTGDGIADALLSRLREEPSSCVREDLTWALVQHRAEIDGELVDMLSSESAFDRLTAAHVISKVADPRHFEAVVAVVADADADVAMKGYRAAANTGGPAAVPALAARLGDGDQLQRDALTSAFVRIGTPAVPSLVEALTAERVEVREHAADALGHLGAAADEAAAALEAAAGDLEAEVRLAAVSALGQLTDTAEAALGRLASGGDAMVAAVARAYLAERPSA